MKAASQILIYHAAESTFKDADSAYHDCQRRTADAETSVHNTQMRFGVGSAVDQKACWEGRRNSDKDTVRQDEWKPVSHRG